MSKADKQQTLVPRLRFPEFRNSDGWQTPELAELYGFKRTNTLSRDQLNYEAGAIKNIHYGDIHAKFQARFRVSNECVPCVNPEVPDDSFNDDTFCEEGDIVLADASEDLNDIAKAIEIVSLDGQQVVAGTHTILATRRGDEPIVGFGGYLFQSPAVRAGIQKEAQGAKVFGISRNRISSMLIPLPRTEAEQQKIADCLGSLDDLIAAEGRKLAALRDHKRGLMQQLFPREGEIRPRLRFPEFHKSKWVKRSIGDLLQKTCRPIDMGDEQEYALVTVKRRYGGVVPRDVLPGKAIKVKSQFLVKADDFLISKRQIVHDACGLVPPELDRSIVSNEYSVLTPRDGCNITFFNYFAQQPCVSKSFLDSSVGIVIEKMLFKLEWWLKHEFVFPTIEEQRAIADCLSALDALIAAQAEKLDALRTHKRGLMQQLFPSPEDAGV